MRVFWILSICVLLTGCYTKYQEMGWTGGVSAERVSSDTWRISARGNAYTSTKTVQDYVLLRAAETAQANGGTHFQVVSSADASRTSTSYTPGTRITTLGGTTTTPASIDTEFKPGQDVYVRVLKLPPNTPTAPGLYSAAEVIQFVGSRVEREK